MEQNKAGQEWRKYAEQYPKLLKMWDALPLVARTLFEQQIDIFTGKYPASPSPVEVVEYGLLFDFACYVRGKVMEGMTTNGDMKFITDQYALTGPPASSGKVDGPWRVDAYHEAAHPESGCSGDQVITITDGKITLYVYSNEDEEGEQKLCNLLNQLKIKLDYDRSAEHISSHYQERIKQLEAASSGETLRWKDAKKYPPDHNNLVHMRYSTAATTFILTGYYEPDDKIWHRASGVPLGWAPNLEWLDESASPSDTREEVIKPVSDYQELWDEFAEYVDDDIDSLSTFAGRTVLTDTNFKKLISRLPKTGKEDVLPFAEWVRTETVADGAPKLYHKGSGQRLTLSQLYDLYTQSLNK